MMECRCDCLLNIDGKCTRQSKEDMTALEKWKNDFKEFISELSMPRDDYKGIMEYIDEVPNEALEQQPCKDWHDVPSDEMTFEQARQAVKDLRKKLVEYLRQEPCDDCISRSDVKKYLSAPDANGDRVIYESDLDLLPSVTPQLCDDCISRQAVFDGLASIAKVKARSDAQKSLMGRIMFFVEQLPSVTPKEKTGRWIRWYETIEQEHCTIHDPHCKCSECNQEYDPYIASLFSYCPNCGAKMQEAEK